ncbi:WD40 repeat domain-containing protein [Catenuloplanes japonicus]|uniref:WD40 repeat domain-containing protein n=1 Tax=Catenuloplanes japonicus TaxID=33876 RepID=UPI000A0FB05B|nr:hypothetical protein [Catenuloplanes japonicus]
MTHRLCFGSEVSALAIAPDGTWLASASQDGSVRLWDTLTGTERGYLIGHSGSVSAVAISPDSTWLASIGGDRTVRVWKAATGDCGAVARTAHSLWTCAWSPLNSRYLFVGGSAGLYRFEFKPPIA